MANGKRLGKGLEALLSGFSGGGPSEIGAFPTLNSAELSLPETSGTLPTPALPPNISPPTNTVDMTKIEPNPFQPRKVFDEAELEQLAQSMETQGLLQPIAVRYTGDRYQIIAGERRFRAALRLGWSEIPVQLHDADDQQMAELALTENIQRKDLNPIEKAVSFTNYLEQFGGTHEELAKRLEIDRSTVTNLLRLLKLPKQLQDAVCAEELTQGHVRTLLGLSEQQQIETAAKIQKEGWSVRETERYAQQLVALNKGGGFSSAESNSAESNSAGSNWRIVNEEGESQVIVPRSEQIRQLEEDFRRAFGGVKVTLVQSNEQGKGKLVIGFANHAEFEHVYAAVCKSHHAAG